MQPLITFSPCSDGSSWAAASLSAATRAVTLYVFVSGFVTIGLLALLALVSRNPLVFPSVGLTALRSLQHGGYGPHQALWGQDPSQPALQ
jgi:hypothetical protein